MDRRTLQVYEARAADYREARPLDPKVVARARRFARRARDLRIDLGCGPGIYTPYLGTPVVGLDAAGAMVDLARRAVPHACFVRADLEIPPYRRGSLGGAWARAAYVHTEREAMPRALARLHDTLAVGAPLALAVVEGEGGFVSGADDDLPGRAFSRWRDAHLADVVTGAGFEIDRLEREGPWLWVEATRARTLADTVGPGMRVLVCGLNPSLHAADAGVGYAGPGNRFWAAATAAGLVERPRDPFAALRAGVGMTDLVKRATARASAVSRAEFRSGVERVERLVRWLRPAVVCFVGVSGYRAAVDRNASVGWHDFAGVRAYVMPSTSGLNARTSLEELTAHLVAVQVS